MSLSIHYTYYLLNCFILVIFYQIIYSFDYIYNNKTINFLQNDS